MTRRLVPALVAFLAAGCQGETSDRLGGPDSSSSPDGGGGDAGPADSSHGGIDGGGGDVGPSWEGIPLECGYPAESESYGWGVGDVLEPFLLWTCEEEPVGFPELWCGNDATILHYSLAWCANCEAQTWELLRDVLPELEGHQVELVEVLVEDMERDVAGAEICLDWEEHYRDAFETYIPEGGIYDGALHAVARRALLPLVVVVDRAGVIRIHREFLSEGDLLQEILAIVAEPTE